MTRAAGRLGPYRLIAKLEQGGMAEVHLAAAENELGSLPLRALKVMPRALTLDPHLTEMFLDEARLAVRLNHPNVVQTMEVGVDDGQLYLAMELLEGETVHRLAQRSSELAEEISPRTAAAIVLGVLSGLHYIHGLADLEGIPLGIVHRDITPSNLYVTTAGTVKVCDFGIAKTQAQHAVTAVGMRKGKLGYLAPEQLSGLVPDPRADLFACGVVLWELLAGRRLFRRGRAVSSVAPRLDDVNPSVPRALADVCARALAHDRRDRYPDAHAMWRALDDAMRTSGGALPSLELGQWVERLVGEDVKNLRRLAANAIRNRRVVETLDRPTLAPEATSYTLRPGARGTGRATRVASALVLGCAAVLALAAFLLRAPTSAPSATAGPTFLEPGAGASDHATASRPALVRVEPWPEDALLTFDGEPLPASHRVEVERGSAHRLQVEAPGYLGRTLDVDVQDDLLVQVTLVRATPPAPPPAKPRPPAAKSAGPAAAPSDISRGSPPFAARPLDTSDPW